MSHCPKTEGALWSQQKLNTKLTKEAFDDLDLASVGNLIVESDGEKTNDALNEQLDKPEEETVEVVFDPMDEIQQALYMSQQPLMNATKMWGLAPFLLKYLVCNLYQTFLPIQSLLIPGVIAAKRHSQMRDQHVCMAAPLGSGKNLAFVLLVLNALANRKIR
jgi:superfamily II DNA/RNA helicase